MQVRQGDVLLESISDIPADAKQVPKTAKQVVLAEGEATGHHHSVPASSAVLLENRIARFLDVRRDCVLTHQEHAPIEIPTGKYRVTIQKEYSPQEIRRVQD